MTSIIMLGLVGLSGLVTYWIIDPIKYNISLMSKMVINKYDKTKSPWWSKINDNIYIGAVPFYNQEDEIIKCIGKDGHILSIMRKFENNYSGLFIKTVFPIRWKELNIKHYQIETPDFLPLKIEKIKEAIAYVNDVVNLKEKKIYVHCKAGHGRSVIVVACYLIQYENMDIDESINFIKEKRPCININKDQYNCIKKFNNSL